ncbi:hypothetical protein U14_03385 [Candidatus Moduliflexus flocculans]|uniref:Plasmid stabilization system n=1 Tax=Candidatus Moduliflexus flocculans TaxID=1499966 RepID=A0A081BP18_9BACT|nr:hypothetical protein U14_03385 [Candidatus Moduliflexus flocculans]
MNIRFVSLAQQEFDNAVEWHQQQSAQLGEQFLDEVHRAIKRIATYPSSCAKIDHDLRRCMVSRFPYGLIYGIDEETIVIVAVAHLHRKPRYWAKRQT